MASLKQYIKSKHSTLYDAARIMRNSLRDSKERKLSMEKLRVTHSGKIKADAPLAMILLDSGPKRLNLVFSDFTTDILKETLIIDALLQATRFAVEHDYVLRIIVRNHLPNPKLYTDMMHANHSELPIRYSFYTDSEERVSSPVYRLEVSSNDIFFTENEFSKLKGWIHEQH